MAQNKPLPGLEITNVDPGFRTVRASRSWRSGHSQMVTAMCVHDTQLYTASEDGTVREYRVDTAEFVMAYTGHYGAVLTLDVSGTQGLFSGGYDSTIRQWTVQGGQGKTARTLTHRGMVKAVKLSPAGDYAYSGATDGTLKKWEITTGECVDTVKSDSGSVLSIELGEPPLLLMGTAGGKVLVMDMSCGVGVKTFQPHPTAVTFIAIAPEYVITNDGRARLFNMSTGACLNSLLLHTDAVSSMHYSHGQLFSGCYDGTLKQFDVKGQAVLRAFASAGGRVTAITSKGNMIYSVSTDGFIREHPVSPGAGQSPDHERAVKRTAFCLSLIHI
eukprot:TRINITY_DN5463_c0_g1_i2.p1 TRINITY_DN5463_c0_g1~~TRINITY_DN5463_c0_g1_i2.p1  ORF type:complete len:330 (-),score=54.74 TRINITY_DN5463_c0_g1_i2:180-1169(-)